MKKAIIISLLSFPGFCVLLEAQPTVTTLQTNITAITGQIANVNTNLTNINANISTLFKQNDSYKAQLVTAQAQVVTAQAQVATFKARADTFNMKLAIYDSIFSIYDLITVAQATKIDSLTIEMQKEQLLVFDSANFVVTDTGTGKKVAMQPTTYAADIADLRQQVSDLLAKLTNANVIINLSGKLNF